MPCCTLHNLVFLWVDRWVLRCSVWLNDLSHSAHLCNLAPMWISRWVLRCPTWLKDLSHCPHLWSFSPVWISKCMLSQLACENDLTHMVQGCLEAMLKTLLLNLLKITEEIVAHRIRFSLHFPFLKSNILWSEPHPPCLMLCLKVAFKGSKEARGTSRGTLVQGVGQSGIL